MPPIRAAHFISSLWFEILPVIHLTMAEADLDHPALEKVPFYEARLIHRKDIHTASVHSTGQLYIPFQVNHLHNQTEPVPRRMRATLTETKPMLFYANYQATAYLIINTTE